MIFFFFYFYKIIQLRILTNRLSTGAKTFLIWKSERSTSPQYLQAKEKRERDKGFAYEKARIMRISKQRILKRKRKKEEKKRKINRHFDVNSRKRGGGMASPWKISLFSAWWKKFLVSSRSIHRWNADKRADEPVRALIVESGNSSRRGKKKGLCRRLFVKINVFVPLSWILPSPTKFYQFFERIITSL